MTSKDTLRRIHVLQDHVATDLLDTLTDKKATELLPFVNSQPAPYHPSFRAETEGEHLLQTFSCRSYYSLFYWLKMYPLNLLSSVLDSLLIIPPQLQSTLFISNNRSVVVNQVAYNVFHYNTNSSSEFLQNLEKVEVETRTVSVPLYRKMSFLNQILFSIFLIFLPFVNWLFLYGLVMVPPWTLLFFILNNIYTWAFFIVAIRLTKKYHYNPKTLWNAIRSVELRCQLILMFCNTIIFYILMSILLLTLILPYIFIIASLVIDGPDSFYMYGQAVFGWSSLYGIASFQFLMYYLALVFYPSTPGNQYAHLKLYFGQQHLWLRMQEVVLKAVDAEEAKSLLLRLKSESIKSYDLDVDNYQVDVGSVKVSTGNNTTSTSNTSSMTSPLLSYQQVEQQHTMMYQSGEPTVVYQQPPQSFYPLAQ